MKELYISSTVKKALVDDEDYLRLLNYSWSCSNGRSICARVNGKTTNLARVVLNDYISPYIDHEDRNPFNNQKTNLRPATASQNGYNKGMTPLNTSGVKGVSPDNERGGYIVRLRVDGKKKFIGRFRHIDDAATAYREAVNRHHKEFANAAHSD